MKKEIKKMQTKETPTPTLAPTPTPRFTDTSMRYPACREKVQVILGYSMAYHSKALHN